MRRLSRIVVVVAAVLGIGAVSIHSALASDGNGGLNYTMQCSADGVHISYRAVLPRTAIGFWDHVVIDGTTPAGKVRYYDTDFANTTRTPLSRGDLYQASQVVPRGVALAGRKLIVEIHYWPNSSDTTNGVFLDSHWITLTRNC